jgi:hypothetical protein
MTIIENLEQFLFDKARELSIQKGIDILEARQLALQNYMPQMQEEMMQDALKHGDLDTYCLFERLFHHPNPQIREEAFKEFEDKAAAVENERAAAEKEKQVKQEAVQKQLRVARAELDAEQRQREAMTAP